MNAFKRVCVGGWVTWVCLYEEAFSIRLQHALLTPQAMSMPIRERERKEDATAAIWFITNSDFMAFQQFPFTFFIRSFVPCSSSSFFHSLSLSLPLSSFILYVCCSKCTVNDIRKWVNRCWCCRCCWCCRSQIEMTFTIVSYLSVVYCICCMKTYLYLFPHSFILSLACYLYSEYKFKRINCISFAREMRQRMIFAARVTTPQRAHHHSSSIL